MNLKDWVYLFQRPAGGDEFVQQVALRSQALDPPQDSDLAFNSPPYAQAQRPGLQPWPLTQAGFSLGSARSPAHTGSERGQWAGSAGNLQLLRGTRRLIDQPSVLQKILD